MNIQKILRDRIQTLKKTVIQTVVAIMIATSIVPYAYSVVGPGQPVFDDTVVHSIITTNGLVSTTNGLLSTTNTQLLAIYTAIIGSQPTGVNLHTALATIDASINLNTKTISTALDSLVKSRDYYNKKAILAIEDVQRLPTARQASCGVYVSANTNNLIQGMQSPVIKTKTSSLTTLVEMRRKTMRNPKLDKSIAVIEHAKKYCSKSDVKAGLCIAKELCKDGDVNCKANADQSASLFLVDGYENQAHEDGASSFVMHISNPYPIIKPKASTIKKLKNADSYKYDMLVSESRASITESILTEQWSDRINIFDDASVQDFIKNIDANDTQTQDTVNKLSNIVFTQPSYTPMFSIFSSLGLPWWSSASPVKPTLKGRISRLEFYDLQVNAMYGNSAWQARLALNDGRSWQAVGQALALNNKLSLEMLKKMDRLLFLQAVNATKGMSNPSSASGSQLEVR